MAESQLIISAAVPKKLPTVLSIVGTLQQHLVQSPPSLSRHFLIPASDSSVAFCHLLLETLRSEKLVALVFLGKDWFGLLQYVADKEQSCP
jgi:hypothetical protein